MRIPNKEELPLLAEDQVIELDHSALQKFRKAFRAPETFFPPTVIAVFMKGVFQTVDQLEVDWRKLLHTSQSFEYLKPLRVPGSYRAKLALANCRVRGEIAFLNFEMEVLEEQNKELAARSKIQLMVKLA